MFNTNSSTDETTESGNLAQRSHRNVRITDNAMLQSDNCITEKASQCTTNRFISTASPSSNTFDDTFDEASAAVDIHIDCDTECLTVYGL